MKKPMVRPNGPRNMKGSGGFAAGADTSIKNKITMIIFDYVKTGNLA